MSKRPLSVTVLAWLFIVVGGGSVLRHLGDSGAGHPFDSGTIWVWLVQLLALLGGVFLLYGRNWARWLLGAWMAFHIVLSAFHSPRELIMHIILFAVIGYFLFRPAASAYFRARPPPRPETPGQNPPALGG